MVIIKKEKDYITVNADFTPEGIVVPRAIIRKDGRVHEIEDITGAFPLSDKDIKDDGTCCYICWVKGKQILLNFCEGRWYEEDMPDYSRKC